MAPIFYTSGISKNDLISSGLSVFAQLGFQLPWLVKFSSFYVFRVVIFAQIWHFFIYLGLAAISYN